MLRGQEKPEPEIKTTFESKRRKAKRKKKIIRV